LSKIRIPRRFESLEKLKAWLEQDDADTRYADRSYGEMVYILGVRALRDGYILPAFTYLFEGEGYGAVHVHVGDKVYAVVATTDGVVQFWGNVPTLPLDPPPLD
jgi:hypothetical protein